MKVSDKVMIPQEEHPDINFDIIKEVENYLNDLKIKYGDKWRDFSIFEINSKGFEDILNIKWFQFFQLE